MKNTILVLFSIVTLATTSCVCKKSNVSDTSQNQQTVTVTGKIISIANGKDGYTAVIQDASKKLYSATISRINLQKTGSNYKQYETGEKITVSGSTWEDAEGTTYITVTKLD